MMTCTFCIQYVIELNSAIKHTMFNKLHIGCEYFGCESFNYKTCMTKNKHNIKNPKSADVGIGNGGGGGEGA